MKLHILYEEHIKLFNELMALCPQMAAAAQSVYDDWEQEEGDSFGICDEIANSLSDIVASHIEDIEIDEYGHAGDDHAAIVVSRGDETYVVDIPSSVYEVGAGYVWEKIPDVTFTEDDVVISPL